MLRLYHTDFKKCALELDCIIKRSSFQEYFVQKKAFGKLHLNRNRVVTEEFCVSEEQYLKLCLF